MTIERSSPIPKTVMTNHILSRILKIMRKKWTIGFDTANGNPYIELGEADLKDGVYIPYTTLKLLETTLKSHGLAISGFKTDKIQLYASYSGEVVCQATVRIILRYK